MSSEHLKEFTDANFVAEVMQSDIPVVVDFWAEWCGPCKMLTPIINDIAGELAGKVKIGKLNVDENSKYASQYGVTSIPTVLFVKGGKVVDQNVGLLAKAPLKARIEALLR
jgi:thioredoxin 1